MNGDIEQFQQVFKQLQQNYPDDPELKQLHSLLLSPPMKTS